MRRFGYKTDRVPSRRREIRKILSQTAHEIIIQDFFLSLKNRLTGIMLRVKRTMLRSMNRNRLPADDPISSRGNV